jgi:serine protease
MIECRTINRIVLTVALALTTLGADSLFSQGQQPAQNRRTVVLDGREVVEGEVIIRYRAQMGRIQIERAEFQVDLESSQALGRRGLRRMRSRNMTTREMIQTLRANPDVELVEPNYIIRAQALPNDPSMSALWGLANTGQTVDGNPGTPGADIDADGAWNRTTGSRANIVAVLDTGIDYTHPDLAANVFTAPSAFSVTVGSTTINCAAGTHGYNALTDTCVPFDDNGHGTHVSGIIGAVGNNSRGVTGVNWTASLMALKVLDAEGTGTTTDAIKAIDFAIKAKQALGAQANVRVLNASWSGGPSVALDEEIAAANNAGMLLVASAGSDGVDNDAVPRYPASSNNNNVISVAAVNNNDVLASFSNYGATSVDLAAPGASTLSTYPNDSYTHQSGTSMAAPFVTGAAALVLASCPGYTTAQLKTALMSTVDPVPSLTGKSVSGGRLNVNAAVHTCAEPSVAVNGSTTNITVSAGSTITVNVAHGPGNVSDWVMMVPSGAAPGTWGPDYKYLSGTRTRPATGMTSATLQFTAGVRRMGSPFLSQ